MCIGGGDWGCCFFFFFWWLLGGVCRGGGGGVRFGSVASGAEEIAESGTEIVGFLLRVGREERIAIFEGIGGGARTR